MSQLLIYHCLSIFLFIQRSHWDALQCAPKSSELHDEKVISTFIYCPFVSGIHRWPLDSPHKETVVYSYHDFFVIIRNKCLNKLTYIHCWCLPVDVVRYRSMLFLSHFQGYLINIETACSCSSSGEVTLKYITRYHKTSENYKHILKIQNVESS